MVDARSRYCIVDARYCMADARYCMVDARSRYCMVDARYCMADARYCMVDARSRYCMVDARSTHGPKDKSPGVADVGHTPGDLCLMVGGARQSLAPNIWLLTTVPQCTTFFIRPGAATQRSLSNRDGVGWQEGGAEEEEEGCGLVQGEGAKRQGQGPTSAGPCIQGRAGGQAQPEEVSLGFRAGPTSASHGIQGRAGGQAQPEEVSFLPGLFWVSSLSCREGQGG
jgi:hypothetical protein